MSVAALKGRASLVARAHSEIKLRIMGSTLRPGQQVLEQDLAATLGTSRTPSPRRSSR